MSVGASSNNPYAFIQAQWQRGKTQTPSSTAQGSASQGDAPSQAFAAPSPQTATTPATTPAAAVSGKTAVSSGGTFPRYEHQTLQALLALQSTDS